MGRLLAGGVPVVELVGSEEAVGVEGVGAGEEFWPCPYLTVAGEEMGVGQRNENPPACPPPSGLGYQTSSLFH